MCIACWISKATNTHSEYVILIFHCNSGHTNAFHCYAIPKLPVLLPINLAVRVVTTNFHLWDGLYRDPHELHMPVLLVG